jgi:hypothetical protein
MDPYSRGKQELGLVGNSFTDRKITKRLGEPLGTPKLTAQGSKTVRPPVKPPPQPTASEVWIGSVLQLDRDREAAVQKLAKRGYRTQTEHEFIKLRWPQNKPLV